VTPVTVYVYGVVRGEDEIPEVSGVGEPHGSVRRIDGDDIAAVVSDLPDDYELTAPGLRASLDALEPYVEVRVEFTYNEEALLREVIAEDPSLRDQSQTTSLDARVSLGQRVAERVEQRVLQRGEQLMTGVEGVAESLLRLPTDEVHEDKWAVLVERARLAEADAAVRGISRSAPDFRIGYFGPMPTFSFLPAVQAEESSQSRWGW